MNTTSLRQGKTKEILESSIDCALLAVEIFNKPRTSFKCQGFISLMIMAWTRLFHAYFNHNIGNKYYYKKNNRYIIIDGERKAWDIKECIDKYGKLPEPIAKNLGFFIGLRNKIEHRSMASKEIETIVFGECQSLLYNYESTLVYLFGEQYALNQHLLFSLQFSTVRLENQKFANKKLLSKELEHLKNYIYKYRNSLVDNVYNSQEYSIKLIQIPKISNTNRNDLAIEYVKWSELDEADRDNYQKILGIIKDKCNKTRGDKYWRLRAGQVLAKVSDKLGIKVSSHDHKHLYNIFNIRPNKSDDTPPYLTNPKYCYYDEVHKDYIYKEIWVDFIVNAFKNNKLTKSSIKNSYNNGIKLNINDYE
jgi:hypothetical protein